MSTNPLFQGSLPTPPSQSDEGPDLFTPEAPSGHDEAAELIRNRLNKLYDKEPEAKAQMAKAAADKTRSKHQEYMYRLSTSGKSLAEIQTEWHTYYEALSDAEKHQVWQEFYDANQKAQQGGPKAAAPVPVTHTAVAAPAAAQPKPRAAPKKLNARHHLQAVFFGLAAGSIALLITLFSFFNEVVIAPFIQPSRSASATPIIIGAGDQVAGGPPRVIIPKINVEIPLIFDAKSNDDATIEEALDRGVVHYPTTVLPGENGNAAFFGHSSNNLFNKGQYKFAFVLLHQLEAGDTFYVTYNDKSYAYQVFDKKIVPPTQTDVLNAVAGQAATATLITCDPPGTSLNRLVVWGKQVSPDPTGNSTTKVQPIATAETDAALPANGRTLGGRISDWFSGLF